ncbi:MAG TPA: methionine synthase [Candidatus Latescibacteria bacterium]|jgi:5-methyltetrahydropteroyltriglutamate--homocysteine methyltransferase|nr:methionine synthase [Candidatus Latescibacterota bacterium]|tara:strand:- start:347 stop:1348 length:1002 start_codon:yes stop_codon:yes gene_type:complete
MGILTTVVGSYPVPDWLIALPSEQGLRDAMAVILKTQENAGIDVIADGELGRFDTDHPETNGMIEYFVKPLGNVREQVTRSDVAAFRKDAGMSFRVRPSAVVDGPLDEGSLDLPGDFSLARALTSHKLKFTLTGPHMLCKTLLDNHYGSYADLSNALADVLAAQVAEIDADVVQVDEANLPGHSEEWEWALEGMNRILDKVQKTPAVHLCFGNYGGQSIQQGSWQNLIDYLSGLHADHVLLELAHRGNWELPALKEIDTKVRFGLGVVDIKTNVVESAEEIAQRIDATAKVIDLERIAYINPDCGFWMLKRSVADRKIEALVAGRDLYEKAGG